MFKEINAANELASNKHLNQLLHLDLCDNNVSYISTIFVWNKIYVVSREVFDESGYYFGTIPFGFMPYEAINLNKNQRIQISHSLYRAVALDAANKPKNKLLSLIAKTCLCVRICLALV